MECGTVGGSWWTSWQSCSPCLLESTSWRSEPPAPPTIIKFEFSRLAHPSYFWALRKTTAQCQMSLFRGRNLHLQLCHWWWGFSWCFPQHTLKEGSSMLLRPPVPIAILDPRLIYKLWIWLFRWRAMISKTGWTSLTWPKLNAEVHPQSSLKRSSVMIYSVSFILVLSHYYCQGFREARGWLWLSRTWTWAVHVSMCILVHALPQAAKHSGWPASISFTSPLPDPLWSNAAHCTCQLRLDSYK